MRGLKSGSVFEKVLARLYESALDPSLLRNVLHEVSDALGADSAALFGAPIRPRSGIFFSEGADEAFDWLSRDGLHVHNPRPERALRMRSVRPVATESDLFSEYELKTLPFNVALSKHGMHWEAGGVFTEIDGAPLFFTAQRKACRDNFDKAEIEAITLLFPHLERVARIASRLRLAEAEGMLEGFERTECAALLLDAHQRIVRMNASAEKLMGPDLHVRGGRLVSADEPSDRALRDLAGAITAADLGFARRMGPSTVVLRRAGQGALAVYGMPLLGKANDIFDRARAILVIWDPDARKHPKSTLLAQLYDLTPAEMHLAWRLMDGMDLKQAADARGIALNTARNQLKSIMEKTDTERQAELVGLLTRLARLPGDVE